MPDPPEERVSTLELFFDLVFVFTITQLTSLLADDPSLSGILRMILVLGNVWWMYDGYAWLTNAVPPREPGLRLLLLLAMTGFLVVALAIPQAFGSSGVAFGIGYIIVTVVHTGMFLRSTEGATIRAMGRLGSFNAIAALMLLLAGFSTGAIRWGLWIGAFVLHWITPYFTNVSGFAIRAAHFVERHGLIVLIALGESIVAIGIGVGEGVLSGRFIVTSVLGLALAAALWWLYFDEEDERAEHALASADRSRRPWLVLNAFGYAFFAILGGVVVLAAGIKLAIAHPGEPVTAAAAWFIAGGVATYVLGLVLFRRILRLGPIGLRVALVVLTAAVGIVGLAASPEVELGVLVAVVGGGALVEFRRRG